MRRCPTCDRPWPRDRAVASLAFPKPVKREGRGCAGYLRDSAAKERLGYKNPSSFVRLDGSEVLKGEDWRKRVEELRQRSGGRCEHIGKHSNIGMQFKRRCVVPARDPHHKIKRSRRRDDRLSNLEHLCGFHHDLEDERKTRFTVRRKSSEERGIDFKSV